MYRTEIIADRVQFGQRPDAADGPKSDVAPESDTDQRPLLSVPLAKAQEAQSLSLIPKKRTSTSRTYRSDPVGRTLGSRQYLLDA
jgi:hypothetical protein